MPVQLKNLSDLSETGRKLCGSCGIRANRRSIDGNGRETNDPRVRGISNFPDNTRRMTKLPFQRVKLNVRMNDDRTGGKLTVEFEEAPVDLYKRLIIKINE